MVPGRPGRGPGPGGACQVGRGSGPAGGGAPIFSRGAAPPGPGPQYSAGARPRRGRGPVFWPGRGAPPGQTPGPGRPWFNGSFGFIASYTKPSTRLCFMSAEPCPLLLGGSTMNCDDPLNHDPFLPAGLQN